MQTFISILRGINVSGQKKILMADLKKLYESLKFSEVKTYIQSGNLVFKSDSKISDIQLARKIEKAISTKYKFEVPVIIRTKEELEKILSQNSFTKEKNIDVKKLHVTFLSETPDGGKIEQIKEVDFSPDRFIIKGKEIYLHIPGSYGETKLSNKFFENKLKVSATTRNWNTVNKLCEMAQQ
ncbi:DUF1697 domain-containing protein [Hanamia caeni]|jgi:uncharacterized protein (DUF1697 family)|uniref:DUF1697 domain-containing protein n=1 Tax=Hanamia caeni TaxID=2294116 RepID=A0A3M9NGD4_9BACT|nr:DUF1697 domain-containing protein [Hanamia caeni]RNI36273.1 DUF1697 domain-containing protein [Hanamia caeni]